MKTLDKHQMKTLDKNQKLKITQETNEVEMCMCKMSDNVRTQKKWEKPNRKQKNWNGNEENRKRRSKNIRN